MFRMPGVSYQGKFLPLTHPEMEIRAALKSSVYHLAQTIGERNLWKQRTLNTAADYIQTEFQKTGLELIEQPYIVNKNICKNIIAIKPGQEKPKEIIVVGAHYDTVFGSPGADDNASGVAALLQLARQFAHESVARSIHFVAFANEEPPFFFSRQMGSWHYAKEAKSKRSDIKAMLSLESIGYYSEEKDSQQYPFPFGFFYPSIGNFIGFVSNLASKRLLKKSIAAFRESTLFPSEGVAAPSLIPGVGWSDQLPFWWYGYPAIMVTATAPFRNPYYHTEKDLPETLDYDRFARVVSGLYHVLKHLACAQDI